MIRLLTKSPVLMGIFPFTQSDNPYDKPVNTVVESLNDELGWDRVKNMFSLEYISCHTYLAIKSFYFSYTFFYS